MVRAPCCEKMGLKKGPWTPEEDQILITFIQKYGHENWRALPKQAGLLRCGKSCRLRWTNYLRPDIKRGNFSEEEEQIIIKLHQLLGNRWSAIASRLPGRTDNEIKNFWHTHLKKRLELKQDNDLPSTITNVSQILEQHIPSNYYQDSQNIVAYHPTYYHDQEGIQESNSNSHHDTQSNKEENMQYSTNNEHGDMTSFNNDMVFWYNVFMSSGNNVSDEIS
ncbi:hypothetical protein MTR67_024947 [Solanum verrucosum]|uniref:Uncharacterized protein n=1 Tax=Solanum verrucosum TaxID=315347 RepID=A0AAF0QZY8_SOLVR|nr:transcription factor MYB14-like [Solanum verrucosum]WMV31562.1 hypothetical protein MTR67_024947 [Solanum verrucosum]